MTAACVVVPRAHNEVPTGLFAHIVNSCHQQAQHVNVYPVRRHAMAIVDNGINDNSGTLSYLSTYAATSKIRTIFEGLW